MAGRGRMPRHLMHNEPQAFPDGPPAALPRGRGPMPIHPIEEELAMRHDEIRRLHADNRLMIEENLALRRELAAVKDEINVLSQVIPKVRADKEAQARELIQRGLKLEAELRALEPIKAELLQLQTEAQKLDTSCQELKAKAKNMKQDLNQLQAENQQIGTMKIDIEGLRQELVRTRTAYEYEKKANAEQMEQRQAMEKNLVSMAREIEKLRTEHLALDKRGRAPGAGAFGADKGYTGAFGDIYGAGWSSYDPRGLSRH